jgi:hypothetical protein
VPPSPPRVARTSSTQPSDGTIRVDELVGAPLRVVPAASHRDRPPGAPPERTSASTTLAGRARLPSNAGAEPLDIEAHIEGIVRAAEQLHAHRALDAALIDDLFRGRPDEPVSIPAAPLVHLDPGDEILPRFPVQQAGTARPWSEIDASIGASEQHKRRALAPIAATTATRADSWPRAPEPSKVQALVESAIPAPSWKAGKNLGRVLESVNHPGIHDSMQFPLADLVCREWNEAFGPQSQLGAPLWPTVNDPRVRARLQAAHVSNRLIEPDRLPKLPPPLSSNGTLPDANGALREWRGESTQARCALALVCAAKANGMTDADAIALAGERSGATAWNFMGRLARVGASNLAMIDEIYGLEPVSTERRRDTPGLGRKKNLRSAFIQAMEKFEKMQSDPAPAGLAARAELKEMLPASLESALSASDDSTKLELATLLMHAATAGPQTLERVCTYLIRTGIGSAEKGVAVNDLGRQCSQLAELHARLQGPAAR